MTKRSSSKRERDKLRRLAHEYQTKGYKVQVYPPASELPPFLVDYQPDMIASSDSENVVVEVRTTGSISSSSYMPELASVIERRPNWRYEVVLTNPRSPSTPPGTSQLLPPDEANTRLENARLLARKRDTEGALLLLWTVIESSLRRLASNQAITIDRPEPLYLLKRLYSQGVISSADYRSLTAASRIRSAVAHGYKQEKPKSSSISVAQRLAERLLKRSLSEVPRRSGGKSDA